MYLVALSCLLIPLQILRGECESLKDLCFSLQRSSPSDSESLMQEEVQLYWNSSMEKKNGTNMSRVAFQVSSSRERRSRPASLWRELIPAAARSFFQVYTKDQNPCKQSIKCILYFTSPSHRPMFAHSS